jgi:radial spoke head protein 1
MADAEDDEKSQAGEEEEEEEAKTTIPELWQYATEDKVGKIVKYLNTKEEEELPEAVQELNPENGQSLLMWSTLKQRFVLVEWLIKKCKRDAFAFKDKTGLAVFDKWVEERKAKEERDKEAAEEAAARAAAGETEEEEEEKEPEPEMSQTVLEGMEEEGVDIFVVKRIGELGVYEGGRDASGNKNGLGRSLFVNGDMYIGEYKNNKREGVGTYFWASNGNIYTGRWKNNLRSGVGRMIYTDGGRYYGTFSNDKKNGHGRYTYPNGDTYSGDWVNDIKEGVGTYTFASDSSKYSGTYRNGDFTSGKWILNGGTTYFGVFKNFKPVGKGVFVFGGKFKQEGEYLNGKWIPRKVQNISFDGESDLQITVSGTPILLRFTSEQALAYSVEHVVGAANFRPFEDWVRGIESQHLLTVSDIRIRSLDINPANQEIQSVRLIVDAYNANNPEIKIAKDDFVLTHPLSVVVVILVHKDTPYIAIVRSPNMARGDYTSPDLPTASLNPSGLFQGPGLEKVSEALNLTFESSSMVDITELCFGQKVVLYTTPDTSTQRFDVWLYKQTIHPDYFNQLPNKIALANRDGDFFKVELQPFSQASGLVSSVKSAVALSLLTDLADRTPIQTTEPQRPPTPPPPEPEPIPLYTPQELAMQQAALEAEIAAKKKAAAAKEEGGEEEEE